MLGFSAHPARSEATIASLSTKCARYLSKDQLSFARAIAIATLASIACACAPSEKFTPKSLSYRVVAEHPHSVDAFTEGLAIADGDLYESTGRYGRSSICRRDPANNVAKKCVPLAQKFFGEGLTVIGDRVVQITWKEGTGFVYDRALNSASSFSYQGEGWGLTYDGTHLLMSNGSSELAVFDPSTYRELGTLLVRDSGHAVPFLNELEFARGLIWANIWHTDGIAAIDPYTGRVLAWLDLGDLRRSLDPQPAKADPENVLNGIAYDPGTQHFYVTGKRWPKLFEIEIDNVPAPIPPPKR